MTPDASPFAGTERFRVLRRLGSGGMGVVYAARDLERDEVVALKTLRWTEAGAIYRLKKEFRTLADVAHPNLVTLYELATHGDTWFFTMELVEGIAFTDYVRGERLNVERLRGALRQVAHGVAAIHAAGKLHRDLKPSNVLVTPAGRAVILDFGIAADVPVHGRGDAETVERGIVGTIGYMAPEQLAGRAVPASDWYALGVLLYEALTGRFPYTGSTADILRQMDEQDPPPPETLAPDLPPDLAALCMRLLARDAAARPGDEAVLFGLGGTPAAPSRASRRVSVADALIVGRESHLAELEEGLAAAERGQAVSLYVHGASGMGKTTLVQHFVDGLAREDRAVVLSGRCFARESVPYKALDGVVDSLTRYLRSLTGRDVRPLLTADLFALARVFPVVERVEAVWRLPHPDQEILDPVELRRRAFAALRDLLGRIRAQRPVVVWIDDLQWSDADSAVLLEDLVGPPAPPPILLIASFRSEEIAAQAFLRGLLDRAGTAWCRELRVDPLTTAETRRLARRLLGPEPARSEAFLEPIVRESAGSPFLVEELMRYVTTGRGGTTGISLAEMLDVRMAQFPERTRAFLEALAVAAGPIDAVVARDVAGLAGDERPLVALLQAEHFLRPSGSADRLELYHDRIRETLAAQIAPERAREIHLQLARCLEAHGSPDPDALYEHYLQGGQRDRAAAYATRAGDKAAAALAFERAAAFYRRALDLGAPDRPDAPELRIKLGDALANAGRGADAAGAYLAAADNRVGMGALELRRRAAEQLLRCGHVDRGLSAVQTVLEPLGLALARSPRHALLRLLGRRALVRLRGLGFTERAAEGLDPAVLARIDACWTVGIGLARVDNIRAADFQTLQLLLALRAGEPFRVARALAAEGAFVSTAGSGAAGRATELVRRTWEIAGRIAHPHALAFARFADGIVSFWLGRFAAAREHCEAAERILREQCTGVVWEINTAQTFASSALWFLGELAELKRRVPLRLKEARERGDLYAAADVSGGRPNVTWLVSDDVATARQVLREAMRPWSPTGFHLQHYFSLLAEGQIDLYAGDAPAAWRRTTALWPALARSMLLRVQLIRNEALHLRARCALAVAERVGPGEREPYLRAAGRDARRIARANMPWSNPLAALVRAGVRACRADPAGAANLLARALTGFEAAGMAAYAAAARRRAGALTGGTEGHAGAAAADDWLRRQGVVRPERFTAMLAPGFPEGAAQANRA